ncbi:MAG: hypothetical protein WAU23_02965 [Ferruginibacter sp.]
MLLVSLQCSNDPGKEKKTDGKTVDSAKKKVKPASLFKDTLLISEKAAVFYHPDSVQLEKFETLSPKNEFETVTHESFFQMRNARIVLKKYWPKVRIVEAKEIRYLLFLKADHSKMLIDLDTNPNMYGLYLFTPGKEPEFVDMMNIETALGFYFK